MKVLITGGAGYIGTTLTKYLLEKGYEVTILDRFFFGADPLVRTCKTIGKSLLKERLKVIRGDIRSLNTPAGIELLKGHKAVVHLAAFSVDPWCELNAETTISTNSRGTEIVMEAMRAAKVRRFLFASTCSAYGVCGDNVVNEESQLNPYTVYAVSKKDMEKYIRQPQNGDLDWTIMRFATAFGLSNKMRFDLAPNIMTANALSNRRVRVDGTGNQWRPFLHVQDISRAIEIFLTEDKTMHYTYNVGDDDLVIQIKNLPSYIQDVVPNVEVNFNPVTDDPRSHRMDCSRFQKDFKFKASIDLKSGIMEMIGAIRHGLDPEDTRWKSIQWCNSLRRYQNHLSEMGIAEDRDPLGILESFSDITSKFTG